MIRVGAEGNLELRNKTVAISRPVRTFTVSGTMNDIQSKIATLRPGDELKIAPGSYQGNLDISVSGTSEQPIVIRSQTPEAAVFTGATSVSITGSDVTIANIRFQQTGTATIVLQGLRTKILGNTFEQSGDGSNGASNGVLIAKNLTPGWPPNDVLGSLTSAPLVVRDNIIAGNTFLQPRNTVLWQDHGIVGNEFSFNTIDGPHGIQADFETEAIKIGYSFGTDQTKTRIIFNTIRRWSGIPYVIGIKSNRTLVGYNLLSGRLQLRYGNENAVIGNVVTDGDFHVSGAGHLIKFNVIRTINPRDNYGPFDPFFTSNITNQYGVFDGTNGRPNFVDRLSRSRIEDNVFMSLTASDGAVIQPSGFADVKANEPPTKNVFARNVLVRSANWNNFVAVSLSTHVDLLPLLAENQWSGNVLHCIEQCNDSQITLRLPGPANRIGEPPAGPSARATEFLVPYNDSLIDRDFAFMTTTLAPVSGFAATP